MEDYNPYCPVCSGCGEDGCCSATMCQLSEDGSYCQTYLEDLKLSYRMYKWTMNNLYERLPEDLKNELDEEYSRQSNLTFDTPPDQESE